MRPRAKYKTFLASCHLKKVPDGVMPNLSTSLCLVQDVPAGSRRYDRTYPINCFKEDRCLKPVWKQVRL